MSDLAKSERPLPTIAAEIRHDIEAADKHWQNAVRHAIRAGEGLIEAKARLPHGAWLPWLAENVPGFSARSATNYMRLARNRNAVADLVTVREAVAVLTAPRQQLDPETRGAELEPGSPEWHERRWARIEKQARAMVVARHAERHRDPEVDELSEAVERHLFEAEVGIQIVELYRRERAEAALKLAAMWAEARPTFAAVCADLAAANLEEEPSEREADAEERFQTACAELRRDLEHEEVG
jgi:hypothetical protein